MDFAFDGDAREDKGGVGDSRVDGHMVDVGYDDFVAGNGEVEGGVAKEGDAVGYVGGVFGQAEGVADGVGRVEGKGAEVGIEALHMVDGP